MIMEITALTFFFAFSIVLIPIAFGFLLSKIGVEITRNLHYLFGKRGVMVFMFFGVPIHELGHLIMAKLFGHKIIEVKLFQRDINNPDVLGYVRHAYNRTSLYNKIGNFFIGLGPIFSASFFIGVMVFVFFPITFKEIIGNTMVIENGNNILNVSIFHIGKVFTTIFRIENMKSPLMYLFLPLGISIASAISLSKADLKGSIHGFITILGFSFFYSVLYALFRNGSESQSYMDMILSNQLLIGINQFMISFLSLALVLSMFSFIITRTLCYVFPKN